MAGYWTSSFIAFFWTSNLFSFKKKEKKKKKHRKKQKQNKTNKEEEGKKNTQGQHSAILTEEDWSIKDLLHAQNKFFSCRPGHFKNTDGPKRVRHKES